jgi:two-component system sensor histidine kinase KdpD
MSRGRLRVYVGYAPGVGKTYAALDEARRRRDRGTDVVVAIVHDHGRRVISTLAQGLERVPPRGGADAQEMDLEAVLKRRPAVAVVDELARPNAIGASHAHRWEDVRSLLDAGIDVISTLGIEHLESMRDVVEELGLSPNEGVVPEAVVRDADQLELVDMTPQALLRRVAHGNVFPPEEMDGDLVRRLDEECLTRLRELTLIWMADRVDEDRRSIDRANHPTPALRERILVGAAGRSGDEEIVRRAARIASRRGGSFLVVHVLADWEDEPARDLGAIRSLTEELGGMYRDVLGHSVAAALLDVARAERVTQMVLGASERSRMGELMRRSVVHDVLRSAGGIDVHIIRSVAPSRPGLVRRRRAPSLSARRQAVAATIGALVLIGLTVALTAIHSRVALSTVMLLYLVIVIGVAFGGGLLPAIAAAAAALALVNWFFTPPVHTWKIGNAEDVVALVVFVLVAVSVSLLVDRESRHRAEAERRRTEAAAMAYVAARVAAEDDPLPGLVEQLGATFSLSGVSVLSHAGDGWVADARAGMEPPLLPEDADQVVELGRGTVLALRGAPLPADALQLLSAFAAQLTVAVRARALAKEVADAEALAEADALRTAILAGVSHDLRTPLASIKASVSSLRDGDVVWSDEATAEFLETIETESDRLTTMVENLLDMSRLQTGSLRLVRSTVGFDEVVPAALANIPEGARDLVVDVPETLPRIEADAGLLERALANIVFNAVVFSPPGHPPRILGSATSGRVELRVIDRGPGVAPAERGRMFEPFQRLGDRARGNGIGLGLAVAKGFVEAMDGEIRVEDTPGGGLTMVVGFGAVP